MKSEPQFKVLLADETTRALESQRLALGFHSSNALSAVYLTTLSALPAEKVWEALATLRKYTPKSHPKSPR